MNRRGPRPKTFARWLRAVKPAKLIVETDDGDQVVKVPLSRVGTPRWKEIVETVASLGATKARAVDDKDAILGVWEFAEVSSAAPGYTKDVRDTEDERLLKTFAHLLADAHRQSGERLCKVVELQGQHFAEERKAASSAMLSMDRAMQRLARQTARYRIASGDDDGEGGSEQDDSFLKDLVAPMVKRYMGEAMGGGDATEPPKNGKVKTS